MGSWIIFAISCLLARGAWGQHAWVTPSGGDAVASNAIPEDSSTAVVAETLSATGGTGTVTYVITSVDGDTTSANWKFEISTADLQCKASQSFDYETKKQYVIVVTATDSAGSPAVVTGTVTVQLSDIDEFPSTFPTSCGYATPDAISGEFVGDFRVCDNDVGDTITYAKGSGDANDYFTLNTGTGIMTKSATAFPSNVATSFSIVITAAGGATTATTTVSITLGQTCTCPGSTSGNSGSSGVSLGIFTILAAFVLQKI